MKEYIYGRDGERIGTPLDKDSLFKPNSTKHNKNFY